ncbi:RloB domain-containing protein [Chitinophaga agrisoli]|uniref:RloB domain-containing protein n=1 Tax=Chitinophaga agrisoli TaxID=2607653 RepID=A0A5B2VI11_9BACT|nr:RloB domain-containing protein [Chitinophaga agrisoli]KAA2238545.1 RloB domain-containing protein [Chitinophaga agrisoli]
MMTRTVSKPLFKTLVIVCEDSKVTPNYLKGFVKELADEKIWDVIEVYPLPKPEASTVTNKQPHKSERKKRDLIVVKDEPIIEEEHKQVPVRYVREAQLWRLERGYDEGWAVYDKDGHPYHAAAYTLSLVEPLVHIAFTSIAIEHWFLLHFEQNDTPFTKSKDVPLAKHVTGYTSEKKAGTEIFDEIRKTLELATVNAAWLRKSTVSELPFYERNPYINIDHLIFRLYGYHRVGMSTSISIKHISITPILNGNDLDVQVENKSKSAIITDEIKFHSYDGDGQRIVHRFDRERIDPQNATIFSFDISEVLQLYIEIHNEIIVVDITI